MSKDTTNKQKDIDDVLLSIDSLLDTASGIEIAETDKNTADSTPKSTAVKKADKSPAIPQTPLQPKPGQKISRKSAKRKPVQARKSHQAGENSTTKAAAGQAQNTTAKPKIPPVAKAAGGVQNKTANAAVKIEQSPVDGQKPEIEVHQSSGTEENQKIETTQDNENQDKSANSLNFTTVEDDLSNAMRELPVLDDIVTIEDLALIGSGKELPKKILTEAFKKLSLSDKLIKILENQLADYNITKLEYKYLHELFDELLEKENKKP